MSLVFSASLRHHPFVGRILLYSNLSMSTPFVAEERLHGSREEAAALRYLRHARPARVCNLFVLVIPNPRGFLNTVTLPG
ncbi:MAG TPA: hypothetical protein VKV18_12870, partial [Chthonomonas sp.]|uniref:hypothetical protein n=1 Tax=Chthonomonas sp. TaxID=2282153 RepID=UPI002B4ADA8E